MKDLLMQFVETATLPSDDTELRLKKIVLTLVPLIIGTAAFIWACIYFYLDRPLSASIPMSYSVISVLSLIYFFKTKKTQFIEYSQLFLVLILPFLLMWSLGGFAAGSAVMLWALFAPVSALIYLEKRIALLWFLAYLCLIVLSSLIDGIVSERVTALPELAINIFFLLNLASCSAGLYLLVSYSISEEKRAIENLEVAKKRAEEASKSKSEFLANMSHEIRTPMNGVLGMLELLQVTTNLDEKQKSFTGTARNSAKSLLTIINDILDFSKVEAGQLSLENIPFYLHKTVEDATDLMEKLALSKNITLKRFIQNNLPEKVSGDPVRLRQVLVNLISNAIKFTHHGEVNVSITLIEESDTQLKLRFEVNDTGIGISAQNQEKLFSAFSQADGSITRKFGGTGLGLSISKQLVHLMGGEIGANSVEGQGSTFWFTSRFEKVIEKTQPQLPDDDKEELVKRFAGARVLVVDDVQTNQSVCVTTLKSMGIIVDTATDGQQAVESIARVHYDMVLMDIQMPLMDGFTATEIIRTKEKIENSQHLPIIALTARAMREDSEECFAAGMDDFLNNPFEYEDLKKILLRWLSTFKEN